ncbi:MULTISPECIES: phage terminase large subunit [Mycetohabitans]|uniref:Putative phage terminase large subunit-like protein n=1 Tax=Mycetohabitans endofungorum TaxID=417203 RepID=A0A2P5KA28_9BURK|nr:MULTISPECIES: phage terminase large subunit [Mycetohabitans]PPB83576.1 putative phage terminase large subunit-like protein [Mycetohabitans endofungorum]
MHPFSPDEHFAAAKMAQADLYFFSRWMFYQRRRYKWLRGPHHKAICDALMRVFFGKANRLIINVPPRYSKTELAVVNFIAWTLGQVPDAEFIHASYAAPLAASNSANVRSLVQHEAYQQVFPACRLASDSKSHWSTTEGGVMYAAGAGGTITGFGAGKHREGFGGAIIIDDPHKPDEAKSDVIRQGVIDWFQNTLESRKNSKDTPIILIMQRLHEHDLAGWLLDGGNGESWEHVCLPAIQADGTALWPEKHTIDDLRRMEQAAPYVFAGQYLQRPSPPDGGLIKPDAITTIDALPVGTIKWVRGWDLAATIDGDYTAGAKLGKLEDGRFVIADVVRLRCGPDERDAALTNTAARDGKSVRISLPQDPGQAGKTQALYLTRKLAGYAVTTSPESGDKATRAEPLAAQINVGNVLMLRGPWNDALLNEMRLFPNGTHDDQVDACSRAFAEIMVHKRGFFDLD